MENKLQNLKFRVYSEAHSKAIQEKLFEFGKDVKWVSENKQVVKNLNYKFLYLDDCEYITFSNSGDDYFNNAPYKESTLDDLYKMQSEPNPQSELITKLESIQKELDNVKEEISKLNK